MMANRLLTVVLAGHLLCGGTLAFARSKAVSSKTKSESPPEVQLVLQREVREPLDRTSELKAFLNREPDSPTARWQTGYLQTGDSWRRYDAPADSATTSELMQRYREARYPLVADDYKSQLHVAQWCHRHGLTGQEYAHLTAAFPLAPASEQDAIANRLGYRQVGGHWLNREELADLAASAKQTEIGLKHWGKKVERIANQLSGGRHQREAALASLQEIADPAAIPAIELSLASKDQHDAVLAIEAIARIDAYQASSALARHAVFSPWPAVRESAITALKSRRFEDFVPPLL
ncbi:MAG TPA: HEAT repeat domain-containing protein, partial [Planctomycetaceae bacterium]|nr:HEAT repeat domain-containing protein [Planctomycetaceae bacterium]